MPIVVERVALQPPHALAVDVDSGDHDARAVHAEPFLMVVAVGVGDGRGAALERVEVTLLY